MNESDDAAFVDTNVLAYAFERGDSSRKTAARDLITRPTQSAP